MCLPEVTHPSAPAGYESRRVLDSQVAAPTFGRMLRPSRHQARALGTQGRSTLPEVKLASPSCPKGNLSRRRRCGGLPRGERQPTLPWGKVHQPQAAGPPPGGMTKALSSEVRISPGSL